MLIYSHSLIGKTVHKYILDNLGFNLSLADIKYGCMKPDFYPKLMAIPHYKNESFEVISQMILSLQKTKIPVSSKQINHFSMELGVILHYITDYFCYPHNNDHLDKISSHFIYEINLDKELRKYISVSSGILNINLYVEDHNNLKSSLIDFIEGKHKQYLESCPSMNNDIRYGLQACCVVALGIITSVILKSSQEVA